MASDRGLTSDNFLRYLIGTDGTKVLVAEGMIADQVSLGPRPF